MDPNLADIVAALSNNKRSIRKYRILEDIRVPRCGRTEDDKYSPVNKFSQGRIIFVRWDATYRNRVEVDYPGGKAGSSVIFPFTLEQWRKIHPKLEVLK